jgi:ubiquinone/menaquinone biosynthesis C-methylase UbiE
VDLKALQRNWDELGRTDPLWAVLTAPCKRGGGWDLGEFLQTGVETVDALMRYIEGLGVGVGRGRALDFGCGVGRLTQPLARYFEEVEGVDIAPSMVELAERYNRQGGKCRFHVNASGDLSIFVDESFDFVLSLITLQHMPPAHAERFIVEFLRVLRPSGVSIFQTAGEPTLQRRSAIAAARRVLRRLVPERLILLYRKLRYGHLIDMYGMRPDQVRTLVEGNGGEIVDIVQDTSAGGGWTSFRYCVRKRETDGRGEMQ